MAQLLDQFGRPIQTKVMTTEQAAPTLMGVRRAQGNHQAPNLTPERLARILRRSIDGDPEAYLELAEDMEERNEHYAGVLGVRKRQVSGLDITVEAVSDAADDVKDADLIREFISRDVFEDELFDILDAVGKGFSQTEIIWDTSESQWAISALKWRDPRWFRFRDDDGETVVLRGLSGDEDLWPAKWISHRAKIKSGLPIRGGLARSAAWAFFFKSFNLKDWAVFCESYGQPLRLGKYGADASEEAKATLMRAVASIGSDFAAIVPESMTIDFIESKISGSIDLYERRADWLDRQISKLVFGQTATTDAQAGGYAVGKVHDGVREDIERADARQLAASLNRDLVIPLISLNNGPRKKYPKIKIGRPDVVDTQQLVDNVTKLVPLGLKVGMSTMRDRIGLPDPDPDEELLRPGAPIAPDPATRAAPGASATAVNSVAGKANTDAIDLAAAEMIGAQWETIMPSIVGGLEEKLANAATVEDAKAIIAQQIETMGVASMAELMAKATFAARLAGETREDL